MPNTTNSHKPVGGEASILQLDGHSGTVNMARCTETEVFSVSDDCSMRRWNLESGCCTGIFRGHSAPVFALQVLKGGLIITGSRDGTLKLWKSDYHFGKSAASNSTNGKQFQEKPRKDEGVALEAEAYGHEEGEGASSDTAAAHRKRKEGLRDVKDHSVATICRNILKEENRVNSIIDFAATPDGMWIVCMYCKAPMIVVWRGVFKEGASDDELYYEPFRILAIPLTRAPLLTIKVLAVTKDKKRLLSVMLYNIDTAVLFALDRDEPQEPRDEAFSFYLGYDEKDKPQPVFVKTGRQVLIGGISTLHNGRSFLMAVGETNVAARNSRPEGAVLAGIQRVRDVISLVANLRGRLLYICPQTGAIEKQLPFSSLTKTNMFVSEALSVLPSNRHLKLIDNNTASCFRILKYPKSEATGNSLYGARKVVVEDGEAKSWRETTREDKFVDYRHSMILACGMDTRVRLWQFG